MNVIANPTESSAKAQWLLDCYLFDEDAAEFRKNFNRTSFAFRHCRAGHPMFEIPRLIGIGRTCAKHPPARPMKSRVGLSRGRSASGGATRSM